MKTVPNFQNVLNNFFGEEAVNEAFKIIFFAKINFS